MHASFCSPPHTPYLFPFFVNFSFPTSHSKGHPSLINIGGAKFDFDAVPVQSDPDDDIPILAIHRNRKATAKSSNPSSPPVPTKRASKRQAALRAKELKKATLPRKVKATQKPPPKTRAPVKKKAPRKAKAPPKVQAPPKAKAPPKSRAPPKVKAPPKVDKSDPKVFDLNCYIKDNIIKIETEMAD